MFVSECVLAYINKTGITALLKKIRERFTNAVIVDYEMFNPEDSFGRMMVQNFNSRGLPLYGMDFFNSLKGIKEAYNLLGFEAVEVLDMNKVTTLCIDPLEHQRIIKLEFLDEYEEFRMMQGHYFISMAKHVEKKEDAGAPVIDKFQIIF